MVAPAAGVYPINQVGGSRNISSFIPLLHSSSSSDGFGIKYLCNHFSSVLQFCHNLLKTIYLNMFGHNSFFISCMMAIVLFSLFILPPVNCSETQSPVGALQSTPKLQNESVEILLQKPLTELEVNEEKEDTDIVDAQNSVPLLPHTGISQTLKLLLLGRETGYCPYSNLDTQKESTTLKRRKIGQVSHSDRVDVSMHENTSLKNDVKLFQPVQKGMCTSILLDQFFSRPKQSLGNAWDFISELLSAFNPMEILLQVNLSTWINPILLLVGSCCMLYLIRHPVIFHAFNVNGPVAEVQQDASLSMLVGNPLPTFPTGCRTNCVFSRFFPFGPLPQLVIDTFQDYPVQCKDSPTTTTSVPVLPDFIVDFRNNEDLEESSKLVLPRLNSLPEVMHPADTSNSSNYLESDDVCSPHEAQIDEGCEVLYSKYGILKGFSSNRIYN